MRTSKPSQLNSWQYLKLIFNKPPAKEDVYQDYNKTRQAYIIEQASAHFERREDDPAPLFGRKLLDVGCGKSTIGEFLSLSGAEITAIDIDPDAVQSAEESAAKYGAPIEFLRGSVEDLLHSDEKYDVILCLDLLEYIENQDKFIWVLKQLLVKHGMIIFSTLNKRPLAWFLHIFLSEWVYGRTPKGSRPYKRFFTPAMMHEKLEKTGLSCQNIQGLGFCPTQKRWRLSNCIGTRYMCMAMLKQQK